MFEVMRFGAEDRLMRKRSFKLITSFEKSTKQSKKLMQQALIEIKNRTFTEIKQIIRK